MTQYVLEQEVYLQMHLFHKLILSSYSRGQETKLDQDEGEDRGSESYEEEFSEGEEEQALMIDEYNESRRNTTKARKEEEEDILETKYGKSLCKIKSIFLKCS